MRKFLNVGLFLSACLALSLTSCKTTEKNYHDAYEKAVAKRYTKVDDDTDKKIEQTERGQQIVVNGDTVNIRHIYAVQDLPTGKTMNDSILSANKPDKYNIVVGQFTQAFTARSFALRLNSSQYPAFVMRDMPKKIYFVVIKTFSTQEDAVRFIADRKNTITIKTTIVPYILVK